jgi:hypothetical protein
LEVTACQSNDDECIIALPLSRHIMTKNRKIILAASLIVAIPVALFVAFYISTSIYYSGHDELVLFEASGGHKLRIFKDRHWDTAYCVFCQVSGPIIQKEPIYLAAISSAISKPSFTIHSATNRQIFWVTADLNPTSILYVIDFSNGLLWPGPERSSDEAAQGGRLLALVNAQEPGYSLYNR